jgi:hypothetical protein
MRPPVHLDDDRIQRVLHDELTDPQQRQVHQHLETCADCRGRVERARAEEDALFGLLDRLDHPTPAVESKSVRTVAAGALSRSLRRVAIVIAALGLSAAAAYALPGSPLRGWLDAMTRGTGQAPVETSAPPAPVSSREPSGIYMQLGQRLVINFASTQSAGVATVTLNDADEIKVWTNDRSVSFTSDSTRLTINNERSTSSYNIEIPRSAPNVRIAVNGHILLVKTGGKVTTPLAPVSTDRYVLPLNPTLPR